MNSHGQLVKSGSAGATTFKKMLMTPMSPGDASAIGAYFRGSAGIILAEGVAACNLNLVLSTMNARLATHQLLIKKEIKKKVPEGRRVTAPLVAMHAKPLLEEGHETRKMNGEKNQQIVEDIAFLAQQALPMDGLKAFLESHTITFRVKISNGPGAPQTDLLEGGPVNDSMSRWVYTNNDRGDSHGEYLIPPCMQTEVKAGSLEIDIPGKTVLVERPGKPKATYAGAEFAAALSDFLDIFRSFVPKAQA